MAQHPCSESGTATAPEELAWQLLEEAQACRRKQQSGLPPTHQEKQALEDLFAAHIALLERFVAGRRLTAADGDDCLQEVCTRILEGLPWFHSDGRQDGLHSWMKEIVRTQAAKIRRCRSQHPTGPLDLQMEATLVCRDAGPAAECEQHDTQEAVQQVLELLRRRVPELTYQAFYKRWIEQKKPKEIAAELKRPEEEVSRWAWEGKEKFKEIYERMHSGGGAKSALDSPLNRLPKSALSSRRSRLLGCQAYLLCAGPGDSKFSWRMG